jgi:predicted alpha/beta hydrolase family esterase
MRENIKWIVQFHSPTDPLIPVEEGCFVANKLKSEYIELKDAGHFMVKQILQVVQIIEEKCSNNYL